VKAFGLALLLAAAPAHAGRVYVGVATDPQRGAPLYEEHHHLRDDGERLVLYRCTDGTAFARKHVQPGADPQAPAFALEDARFGYREGVQREGRRVFAQVRRSHRHALRRNEVPVTPRLVVDAGFDEFVRRHWSELQRGESVALDFLVPSRRRTYAFAVKRLGGESVGGEAASVLRLAPSGVLGWFAPAIAVVYRDRDRRLLRFEGITNVRENPDDSVSARIDFPPGREQPLTDEDWQAARAAPLARCHVPS
jgi:hypothetical protein